MTISALPSAPLITDAPDVFDAKASAHVASLSTLVTEMNAAISVVNMTKWISGTTYAIGDVTWSPTDFQAYRRKTAGAGTTDPSADATNWQRTEVSGTTLQQQTNTRFTAGGTADAMTGTLSPVPAALTTGLKISAVPVGANTVTTSTININSLGAKKEFRRDSSGTAVPITVGDRNASGEFTWVYDSTLDSAAGGWVLLNPLKLKGTNTNDSAATGYVGESIESFAGSVSAPASNTYGDITSITLTPGDWDISAIASSIINTGVSITSVTIGIGPASGTSGAGLQNGDNQGYSVPPTSQYSPSITIPPKRVSINATTTYYLKVWMSYSSGTPQFQGRISARRVR